MLLVLLKYYVLEGFHSIKQRFILTIILYVSIFFRQTDCEEYIEAYMCLCVSVCACARMCVRYVCIYQGYVEGWCQH